VTRADLITLIRWGWANDRGGPLAVTLGFAAIPIFALLLESFR
jgi:hypothetical protein